MSIECTVRDDGDGWLNVELFNDFYTPRDRVLALLTRDEAELLCAELAAYLGLEVAP